MKKSVIFALAVAAIAIVFAALNAIPASADGGWSATFHMTGWIDSISPSTAPGDSPASTATFETSGDAITAVHVSATDQQIVGGIANLSVCQPSTCSDPSTTAVSDSKLVAIQDYDFDLTAAGVKTIYYTVPGDGVHAAEVVFGAMTGDVGGGFTVGDGPDQTAGSLSIGLEGTGGFACFAPIPGPLAPCMSGDGQMLPIEADFTASGDYAIDITSLIHPSDGDTVFELGNLTVDMTLGVDLTKLAAGNPDAVSADGDVTVTDSTVSYE